MDCKRAGRNRLSALIARHVADMTFLPLRSILAANCPRMRTREELGSAGFQQLLYLVDAPSLEGWKGRLNRDESR